MQTLKAFGLPNCLRITVGHEEENAVLIENLQNIMARATV